MKLHNEFDVAVPVDRVWDTLLDMERVGAFLPGAVVEPTAEEGVYKGRMKMRVGPMSVGYSGTARLAKVDVEARVADIEIEAREAGGQGTAAATITNRLAAVDGGTRVVVETDLKVTGRQAQFGRGIMQDVATRMLDQFATRFERYLLEGEAPATAAPADGAPAGDEEALDVGTLLGSLPVVRYGAVGAALLVVVALILAATRRRRGLEIRLTHTW